MIVYDSTTVLSGNVRNKERLSELGVGEKGMIICVDVANRIVKRHLLDMGLVRGTVVEVKKVAPMGDPVDLKVRGYEICIRRLDLEQIVVEVVG